MHSVFQPCTALRRHTHTHTQTCCTSKTTELIASWKRPATVPSEGWNSSMSTNFSDGLLQAAPDRKKRMTEQRTMHRKEPTWASWWRSLAWSKNSKAFHDSGLVAKFDTSIVCNRPVDFSRSKTHVGDQLTTMDDQDKCYRQGSWNKVLRRGSFSTSRLNLYVNQ